MTVEATSFLSNTKISNGHEKSAKFLKNHKNLIIFLLAFVLLLFCILASILQIWIYNQLNNAQQEIDQLKKDVIDLKSNGLDQDLLAEIAEFNRKYNKQNQIDLDEKVSLVDEKVKFDDVGEDIGAEESDENDDEEDDEEDNYEGYHSGYGEEYDDEYDSLEDELVDPEKEEDENNIYKDMTKHRKTRSITGITEQGVPIHEESYIARRNRTRTSPQDSNKHPKLKLTWNGQYRNLNSPRREHDRNRQHTRHHHHSHDNLNNKFAFAAAPVHHAFESPGPRINETVSKESTPIPIQTRQSRVMHFEDKTKAFRQVVGKEQLAKLKEQRMPPLQYVSYPNTRRRPHPQNMAMKKNLEMKNGKRMKITAVHYDGDSTRLEETRHHSFKGNGKVMLNKNEFLHWKPAEWVSSHGMDKYFTMDSTGTLTVNDHGLFLIYAQVYYSDTHDLNGYEILHNDRELYQCTTMTHMPITKDRLNSCYTSGLIHLRNGDKIRIRDVGNHRHVLLQKSKSYFGLIKINLTAATHSNENTDADRFEQIK